MAGHDIAVGERPRKLGRRARRQLDRLAVQRAEVELQREQLQLDQDLEDAADRQIAREDAGSKPRRRSFGTWLREQRVFLGSAVVSGACAVIATIGQIYFYWSVPKLPKEIALMFPIGVEAISWVMGAKAAACVRSNPPLPSAKYLRRMWAFALFATGVNIVHGMEKYGFTTGMVLGLASVFGPFVWHSYTGMTHHALSGRSMEELKVAAKARLLHPWISWRADRIQTLLHCSRSEAWVYALSFTPEEIKQRVKESLARKLEKTPLAVMTLADAKPIEPAKPKAPKPPTAKPADHAEPKPAPKAPEPKRDEVIDAETVPVPPVNISLVREFGEKSERAISTWLARLDEQDGQGPSMRSIDVQLTGSYTGTAKKAVAAYIKNHGDPRKKRQQSTQQRSEEGAV